MPYAHIKKKIPRLLDRRVKITDEIKKKILTLYEIEHVAIHQIARETGVSRRAVQFILFPERLIIVKAQFKERRKDGRYYDKNKWREVMKEHRRYKESIKDKLI